ncbi:MAG: hypothetical protein MZW92_76105 [Comamonadaceae bacterium]|nr:hypothetical protein [Comamonadaceae bacterium]
MVRDGELDGVIATLLAQGLIEACGMAEPPEREWLADDAATVAMEATGLRLDLGLGAGASGGAAAASMAPPPAAPLPPSRAAGPPPTLRMAIAEVDRRTPAPVPAPVPAPTTIIIKPMRTRQAPAPSARPGSGQRLARGSQAQRGTRAVRAARPVRRGARRAHQRLQVARGAARADPPCAAGASPPSAASPRRASTWPRSAWRDGGRRPRTRAGTVRRMDTSPDSSTLLLPALALRLVKLLEPAVAGGPAHSPSVRLTTPRELAHGSSEGLTLTLVGVREVAALAQRRATAGAGRRAGPAHAVDRGALPGHGLGHAVGGAAVAAGERAAAAAPAPGAGRQRPDASVRSPARHSTCRRTPPAGCGRAFPMPPRPRPSPRCWASRRCRPRSSWWAGRWRSTEARARGTAQVSSRPRAAPSAYSTKASSVCACAGTMRCVSSGWACSISAARVAGTTASSAPSAPSGTPKARRHEQQQERRHHQHQEHVGGALPPQPHDQRALAGAGIGRASRETR